MQQERKTSVNRYFGARKFFLSYSKILLTNPKIEEITAKRVISDMNKPTRDTFLSQFEVISFSPDTAKTGVLAQFKNKSTKEIFALKANGDISLQKRN